MGKEQMTTDMWIIILLNKILWIDKHHRMCTETIILFKNYQRIHITIYRNFKGFLPACNSTYICFSNCIWYEMVTLFLEQFKSKQKPHCAYSQKSTGCHWKQNIVVETGLDM